MKLLTIFLSLLVSNVLIASFKQAPPNLSISRSTKGIFVDFIKSDTKITYDLSSRKVLARTEIEFVQKEVGFPIFDLVEEPKKLLLDDQLVKSLTSPMNGISQVRYINKVLAVGKHKLIVENEILKNVTFSNEYVKSAFWMSDLSDRRYLEQYLPTNLEYDQYKMNIEVELVGTEYEHVVYTNASISEIKKNHFLLSFPEVFTASSVYFHLTYKGAINEARAIYKSIDGRDIPVVVYTKQSINRFKESTLKILAELEKDYGPWPHQKVVVYGAGQGGMEYCGATMTSFSALGHELIHSYFARGVMPAHGNSGWIDEAVASWRDAGYKQYSSSYLSKTKMAGHSVYQRTTDRNAYSRGMKFIGHLAQRFNKKENFKLFLKSFFEERKFAPIKTYEFKNAIEKYYNDDVEALFDKYVYGKNGIDLIDKRESVINPHHKKLSEKEYLDLL